jgi:uncharacterized protein involved in exopolysaccharide biosynthesis
MKENNSSTASEDSITLKDLILAFKKYFFEIIRKWWIIALLAIPLCLYFGYNAINAPVTYTAKNRFLIESSKGGSLGNLGGLLGSFGFGKQNGPNPFKIIEVGLSTKILDQVFLDTLEGTNNLLGNEIIEKYELDKLWTEKNPEFENFRFKTGDKTQWELIDQKAYKRLIKRAIGTSKDRSKALYKIMRDEDSGIYTINCTTIDHNISYSFSNALFDRLKYFFENEILESQFKTKELLRSKKDSLDAIINIKTRELALFEDSNRGTIGSSGLINRNKILTEISGLSIAYQETFKNYEIADFSYQDKKPFFMLIDTPLLPLSPLGGALIIDLIIALFLAFFMGITFIIGRKIYLEAMAE